MAQKNAKGNLKIYKKDIWIPLNGIPEGKHWIDLAKAKFGKSIDQLNLAERRILNQHMDALGSITNGNYGGGHTKTYYKEDGKDNIEAFAQTYAAYSRNDEQFRLEFQWKI